jgi:hypothetical protein
MRLTGRGDERGMLDQFVEAIRAGESRALVLSGEAGVGKTALLEYLVERAADCRVLRPTGVQSEMELAFSALHQLCSPSWQGAAGIVARHVWDADQWELLSARHVELARAVGALSELSIALASDVAAGSPS